MIAQQHTDHEPVQGLALRRSLAEILDRPVTALPTPEQTLGAEASFTKSMAQTCSALAPARQARATAPSAG